MHAAEMERRSGSAVIKKQAAVNWRSLAHCAKTYLVASAWESAFEMLWAVLRDERNRRTGQPDAMECMALLVIASRQLGRDARVGWGCAWLTKAMQTKGWRNNAEGAVLASCCLGLRELDEGRPAGSRSWLARLDLETVRSVSPWTRARRALLLAKLEAQDGNLSLAECHGLEMARLAEQADCELLQGDAYSLLGIVARMRGSLEEASVLYARAGRHYWQCGNLVGRCAVLLNQGIAVSLMGHHDEGRRLLEDSRAAAFRLDRRATELRAMLGLGWIATRTGRLEDARKVLLPAWRLAQRLGSHREEVLALEYLVDAYSLGFAPAKARMAYRRARAKAESAAAGGDLALELKIRETLLLLAGERPRRAIARAREAIRHAKAIDMKWEHAQACRILGIAYLKISRKPEARTAFRKAHELLSAMGERFERRVVEAWLSALDRPAGDAGAHDDSASLTPSATGHDEHLGPLRFWLTHPLLGPLPWSNRKRRMRRPCSRGNGGALLGEDDQAPNCSPELPTTGSKDAERPRDRADSPDELREIHPLWAESGLVTLSSAMGGILKEAETYARGMLPVLILGETGTGKDLLAQGLHALSGRAGRLVPVNCAAARKELFFAELFGARRGAYTGAIEHRTGLIQEADGGTLFFDEIGDLEPEAQGFLLRFLDDGEVRPVGSTKSIRVEARIVAATCRDLAERVQDGGFREDLYRRLAGLVIELPPLRERSQDLALLVRTLWQREGACASECEAVFTGPALRAMRDQRWAGNVRELRHLVYRAVIHNRAHGVRAARAAVLQLLKSMQQPLLKKSGRPLRPKGNLRRQWNRQLLYDTLQSAGGFVPEAARLLGLSRSHAYRLYRQFDIQPSACTGTPLAATVSDAGGRT